MEHQQNCPPMAGGYHADLESNCMLTESQSWPLPLAQQRSVIQRLEDREPHNQVSASSATAHYSTQSSHTLGPIHISGNAKVHIGDQHNYQQHISRQVEKLNAIVQHLADTVANRNFLGSSLRGEPSLGLQNGYQRYILSNISERCRIHHDLALQKLTTLDRVYQRLHQVPSASFWKSPLLVQWNASSSSSAIFVKGTRKHKFLIRAFCVRVIQQLSSKGVAVLHVLSDTKSQYSLSDIPHSLIFQALNKCCSEEDEYTISDHFKQLNNAFDDNDLLALLGRILARFETIFIIMNAEVLESKLAIFCRDALLKLFKQLQDREASTRVLLLTTGQRPSHTYNRAIDTQVLTIGGKKAKRERSRGGHQRLPGCRARSKKNVFIGLS